MVMVMVKIISYSDLYPQGSSIGSQGSSVGRGGSGGFMGGRFDNTNCSRPIPLTFGVVAICLKYRGGSREDPALKTAGCVCTSPNLNFDTTDASVGIIIMKNSWIIMPLTRTMMMALAKMMIIMIVDIFHS